MSNVSKREMTTIRVSRRILRHILWIGGEAYPLQNIAPAQTAQRRSNMYRRIGKLTRIGAALAVAAALLPATSASAAGEIDGPWYIVHHASGRCLDAPAQWGGVNGTPMQLWDCYPPTQYNQMWLRRWRDDNTFDLINVASRNAGSDRCLDAPAEWAGADGKPIQLWDCYPPSQTNQLWRQTAPTTGWRLQNVKFPKMLQPAPWSANQNGTAVQSWYLNTANDNQVWDFRRPDQF